jgi:hypothetical protein
MSVPTGGLLEMAQEAESLAERLGFLCNAALTLMAQQNTEGLLEVLAEQAQLRSRIDPLVAQLLSSREPLPPEDALDGPLLRIAVALRGAQHAGALLEGRLGAERTQLGARIEATRRGAGAVTGYGEIDVRTSTGFTRMG